MIVYHGSNIEIDTIKLEKCMPYKDFGKGFYTSPIKEHASKMAKRTTRINKTGVLCVTAFFLDDAFLSNTTLKIKQFSNPDKEWARFVMNNRNRQFKDVYSHECNTDAKYDIVIGPVANDDIIALMDIFLTGLISDDALAKELTFRELSNQISFHTEKAISLLQKTKIYHG